jgi:uncharacterized cupredoxin-like copper-binding protein
MGRSRRPLAIAVLVAATLAVVAVATTLGARRTIEIDIRYSHFVPATLTVPTGVPVTFVIHNADPIDHEWIVGDAEVQAKHRTGTELLHPSRPTEVVIPAGETRVTTITFGETGSLQYICHLPAHEAYGMVGTVTIR